MLLRAYCIHKASRSSGWAGLEGVGQEQAAPNGQRRVPNGQAGKAPEYAGAYSSGGRRAPAHEQWCSLVGIFGVSHISLRYQHSLTVSQGDVLLLCLTKVVVSLHRSPNDADQRRIGVLVDVGWLHMLKPLAAVRAYCSLQGVVFV